MLWSIERVEDDCAKKKRVSQTISKYNVHESLAHESTIIYYIFFMSINMINILFAYQRIGIIKSIIIRLIGFIYEIYVCVQCERIVSWTITRKI